MNILLVRLRLIGDVVFTTPAIRALRRQFPAAGLSYLVEPAAAAVVEPNTHLNEVIIAPGPGAPGRLVADARLARALRRHGFDVAIDFHGGPRAAWLTLASGARRRIGYDIPGRRWMYTDAVARARELRPRHSVVNQWDLLAPLGVAAPGRETDPTEMPEDRAAAASLEARMAERGLDPARDRIVIVHVSAGNPFRRWSEARFADLVVRLLQTDGTRRVVLTSGPSDAEAARRIGRRARADLVALGRPPGSVVDDLELGLAHLNALARRAALFIGGDSGPLHVAGTTEVPIVGLYGPTLPARSAPWRSDRLPAEAVEVADLDCRPCDQRRCVPGDFRCLGRIEAAGVAAAAERVLAAADVTARRAPGTKGASS